MNQLLMDLGIDPNSEKALILEELKAKKEKGAVNGQTVPVNYLIAALELALGQMPSYGPNKPIEQKVVEEKTIDNPFAELELTKEFNNVTNNKADANTILSPVVSKMLDSWKALNKKLKLVSVILSFFITIFMMSESILGFLLLLLYLYVLYTNLNKATIYAKADKMFSTNIDTYKSIEPQIEKMFKSCIKFFAIPEIIYIFGGLGKIVTGVVIVLVIYFVGNYLRKQLDAKYTFNSPELVNFYNEMTK